MSQGNQGRVVVWGVLGWLCVLNVSAWGQFSGGSGTGVDPYLISDPNELQAIGLDTSHWDKHFKLVGDLDLTGVAMTVIGNLTTNFTGTFDGDDRTIANLTIHLPATDYVGLFGVVDNTVDPNTIINLSLIDSDITGKNQVGGLAGYLKNGIIIASYNSGQVSGTSFVGGLVGWNSVGAVRDSYTSGQVNGTNAVGGLVGFNNGTVSHCTSTVSVDGTNQVGGLVGYNLNGMILECYARGAVTGTDSRVGGLAGINDSGTISDCYAIGAVNGFGNVGGLVGRNWKATIIRCFSSGAVSGTSFVGGLMGAKIAGTVSQSFWDTQTSGQSSSPGGTGKTTAQMKMIATFTRTGWDFATVWAIGDHQNNQGYPYLLHKLLSDLNYDGVVNTLDFIIMGLQWLEEI